MPFWGALAWRLPGHAPLFRGAKTSGKHGISFGIETENASPQRNGASRSTACSPGDCAGASWGGAFPGALPVRPRAGRNAHTRAWRLKALSRDLVAGMAPLAAGCLSIAWAARALTG